MSDENYDQDQEYLDPKILETGVASNLLDLSLYRYSLQTNGTVLDI